MKRTHLSTWRMIFTYLIVCGRNLLSIFIIVTICCPILNCMIHYNVCNNKGKYWTILWASGIYCGRLDLVIPIAHRAIGFKSYVHTLHVCTPCMYAHPACMHTLHVCTPCMYAHPACMHTLHVCTPCMYAHPACMHTLHICTPIYNKEYISINNYVRIQLVIQSSSSFVSSNRILPFVYTFSGIFVELLKVIKSAGMC